MVNTQSEEPQSHDAGSEPDVLSHCQQTKAETEKKKKVGEESGRKRGRESPWLSTVMNLQRGLFHYSSASVELSESRPCGAAAEMYGSLIISTNTFQYNNMYTQPPPQCPPGHPVPSLNAIRIPTAGPLALSPQGTCSKHFFPCGERIFPDFLMKTV